MAILRFISNSESYKNYRWDDILYIFRPVIYLFLTAYEGRRSYYPIKISLFIDFSMIICSIYRLLKAQ